MEDVKRRLDTCQGAAYILATVTNAPGRCHMPKRRSSLALTLSLVLTALFLVAVPLSWSDDSDSPVTVGEWKGSWKSPRFSNIRGDWYLTIKKVEGNTAWGRVEFTGTSNPWYNFEVTFTDNTLRFIREDSGGRRQIEMTFTGNTVTGSSTRSDGFLVLFTATKQK